MLALCFSFTPRIPAAVCHHLLLPGNIHRVVLSFPAVYFEPKESESNWTLLFIGHGNIDELDANGSALRRGIGRVLPVVAGPVQ